MNEDLNDAMIGQNGHMPANAGRYSPDVLLKTAKTIVNAVETKQLSRTDGAELLIKSAEAARH